MANTAAVYARIDPALKKDVEAILEQLHITPSALIQMLYGQIKLNKGIPFELKIPTQPIFVEDLSEEQLNAEITKGVKDYKEGKTHSLSEVKKMLK